ncbi:hypothetical protein CSHISOI_07774 [Colletotrichum shisoi]|uniref:Uncharacterized protein n=1 Tax=Colletotrichum shisoi TaxID=2078593 RepID=A0A5Q4BL38_9PEZI|nr:hypothetical protein CSHISOI_07774 [Colletotrichum shisoi]
MPRCATKTNPKSKVARTWPAMAMCDR